MAFCVSSCQLRQIPLDFDGNAERVLKSISEAKCRGAGYRTGPDLELSGYGCDDHFLEADTFHHCWQALQRILLADEAKGILFDVGMPVMFENERYISRIFCYNGVVLLICPKVQLSRQSSYYETRYFNSYSIDKVLVSFDLPLGIRGNNGDFTTYFGFATITCSNGIRIASVPFDEDNNGSESAALALSLLEKNVDILSNPSARTGLGFNSIYDRCRHFTKGVFLFAPHVGIDGGRRCFTGGAYIAVKGQIVASVPENKYTDVDVVVFKMSPTFLSGTQPTISDAVLSPATVCVTTDTFSVKSVLSSVKLLTTHETYPNSYDSMCQTVCVWLWEYLKRSGARGFFVPLSCDITSAAVAAIVASMCKHVYTLCSDMEIESVIKIKKTDPGFPKTHKELTGLLLHTADLGVKGSYNLPELLGSCHLSHGLAAHLEQAMDQAMSILLLPPQAKAESPHGAAALKERLRMITGYFISSLFLWARGLQGFLLVLGNGNYNNFLTGYQTKYGMSSADINPLGGFSMQEILQLFGKTLDFLELRNALPAETWPVALDTSIELTRFNTVPDEIPGLAGKMIMSSSAIERHAKTRHKLSIMTPSVPVHKAVNDGMDNRRPMLYPELFAQNTCMMRKEMSEMSRWYSNGL